MPHNDMKESISVVIPAYNEEENLAAAIGAVEDLLAGLFRNFEIIVINDGSKDRTGQIADDLAKQKTFLRVIHNPRNRGLGFNLQAGFGQAKYPYVTWFPGDNSVEKKSFAPILEAAGEADLIIAYMANVNERTFVRRVLSKTYTRVLNAIFGLRIKYYNGLSVFPAKLIQSIHCRAQGHDCLAEILIRCLKLKASYIEVPFWHKVETEGRSRALSWKNLTRIAHTTWTLFFDVYVRKNPHGKRF